MAKTARKLRRPRNSTQRPSTLSSQRSVGVLSRVQSLDALRGIAILLMIIDHVSGILLKVNIEYTSIRLWTRLSMPLFAVLMGYFLVAERPPNFRRLGHVVFACLLVNVTYVRLYSELEILASLLCAGLLFLVMRTKFAFAYLFIFLAPWDISAEIFDYPLALVIPCVALGYIVRKFGWLWGVINSLFALPLILWMEGPTQLVLYFLLPAVLLVAGAARLQKLRLYPLEFLGRYPLTIYVVQYYVIFSIAALL